MGKEGLPFLFKGKDEEPGGTKDIYVSSNDRLVVWAGIRKIKNMDGKPIPRSKQ